MNDPDIAAAYRARLAEIEANWSHRRTQTAAAVAIVAALAAFALALASHFWIALALVFAAAVAAWRWSREHEQQRRCWRLKQFYERGLKRVEGQWPGGGSTGEQFDDPQHPYARDLNLFGEGSLFELLCIGRSGIGQRGLALFLKQPAALEVIRSRQQAVRELAPRTDLREQVAVLGPHSFSESRWETYTQWLDSPPVNFPHSLAPVFLATSCVLGAVGLIAGGTLLPGMLAIRIAAPLILFHVGVGLIFKQRTAATIAAVSALSRETQVLREGLGLLEQNYSWQSELLKQIAQRAQGGAEAVRSLERLLDGVEQRNKDWFFHASRLLLVGTQLAMRIERWRRRHGAALLEWIEAWAEFEALNALGGYAHEHPKNAFPEILEDSSPAFEARELGHPLLPRSGCVSNNVELNAGQRFYIVSGSNMSGKSTLLRAIGLNAVLAMAGAPVPAASPRMTRLAVCASIGVEDSLLNGKSKFLAEVDRLKLAIETACGETPVLFLVDEIFSGTNSSDRRIAAEAVVRTLVDRRAIGALSTHDLALAELADQSIGGINVHMGSRGNGDPMDFDYLLKPGVTREANALAIAKMAGVPL